jgi:putative transposase
MGAPGPRCWDPGYHEPRPACILLRNMPSGLKRFQQGGGLHFITFSCHHRSPHLGTPRARDLFENALETVRVRYRLAVLGYVVMPEHVHLLLSEPARGTLAQAIQALKLSVTTRSAQRPFWQARYYDFNVRSAEKTSEKLNYIHRNPVVRGLVTRPEDWPWSSFRHYATGERRTVEIESFWTAWERANETLTSFETRPPASTIPGSQHRGPGAPHPL